ncbi:MAG: ABC transporter permease [Gemmatimonadota bacterium]
MSWGPIRRLFLLAGREPSAAQSTDAEVEFHLSETTAWLIEQGWKPDQACEEARRQFGDVERFRKELGMADERVQRVTKRGEWWGELTRDLRYAVRGLRRAPAYAFVVIATLGLALGANATMFGILDRLLLRPPAHVVEPASVKRVVVARWFETHLSAPWSAISYPGFTDLRDGTTSFAGVAATVKASLSLGIGIEAKRVRAELTTGQYFPMLGTEAALGRFYGEAEAAPPDGAAVVVLSYPFWQAAFAADHAIIGRTIRLAGRAFTVVAVAPKGFTGADTEPIDLWVPLPAVGRSAYGRDYLTGRNWQFIEAFMRVKPGVTDERAAADATLAYQRGHANEPRVADQKGAVYLRSLSDRGSDTARIAFWLYGVTVIVLLIACANVANVVLARGLLRQSEIAVRQALGVRRGRLVRQLLVESLVLGALGALLGVGLSQWAGDLVRALVFPGTAWDAAPVNGRVLLVTAAATLFTAVVAALLPMLRTTRTDLAAQLHGGRGTSRQAPALRFGLLAVQTALCTALVVGAGLFVKSLTRVRGLDLGIDVSRTLLVSSDLLAAGTPEPGVRAFFERAVARLRLLPGVESVGASIGAPFMSNYAEGVQVPGNDSLPRLAGGGPYFFQVSPGAVEGFGMRVLRGRSFAETDRQGTAPVVLVTERMARTLWPNESALGKCFFSGPKGGPCREVVGVVADVHRQGLDEEPFLLYFTLIDQREKPRFPDYIVVRTAGPPEELAESIRRALLSERADLPFVEVMSYQRVVNSSAQSWRAGATMFTVFGGLSLLIAAIGVGGVVSFAVSQRAKELGIRAALGAAPGQLVRVVVSSAVGAALLGAAIGIAFVLLLSPRMESLLFHTSATDPTVLVAALATVIALALVASLVPGRRAAQVDPIQALRSD